MTQSVPRTAIIGAGGYAREHHRATRQLEERGVLKLIAACDPMVEVLAAAENDFALPARGVRAFSDYLPMLDFAREQGGVMVEIPTPVPLHAPMHKAAVERGLAVYLEKPPTLDPEELERMIALDASAEHATQVGFNFIVQPERQALKRRLLDGEFGTVEGVSFFGRWPRAAGYYQRASWAGRLITRGQLTLDSCLTNAMAHYVHDCLFWAGRDGLYSWARPQRVASTLWRANDIESFDTVFLEAQLDVGVPLRLALTHAAQGEHRDCEVVRCGKADVRFYHSDRTRFEVAWRDGRIETVPAAGNATELNLEAYLDVIAGRAARPMTRLADARPFVQLGALAFMAAGGIQTRQDATRPDGDEGPRAIPQIDEQIAMFVAGGPWPARADGRHAPMGEATPADLPQLRATIEGYAAQRAAEGWREARP